MNSYKLQQRIGFTGCGVPFDISTFSVLKFQKNTLGVGSLSPEGVFTDNYYYPVIVRSCFSLNGLHVYQFLNDRGQSFDGEGNAVWCWYGSYIIHHTLSTAFDITTRTATEFLKISNGTGGGVWYRPSTVSCFDIPFQSLQITDDGAYLYGTMGMNGSAVEYSPGDGIYYYRYSNWRIFSLPLNSYALPGSSTLTYSPTYSKTATLGYETADPMIYWGNSGTDLYLAASMTGLFKAPLTTAYNISSMPGDLLNGSVRNTALNVNSLTRTITFSQDGEHLYGVWNLQHLYQYEFSTGWDIATGSVGTPGFVNDAYVIEWQLGVYPNQIMISPDGAKLYLAHHVHYGGGLSYSYTEIVILSIR
jgi:hypothetical protein